VVKEEKEGGKEGRQKCERRKKGKERMKVVIDGQN
jgi:hypothetical protein